MRARPGTPAPSIRSPPASSPSRWARRPRPCRMRWRARKAIASRCGGAPRPTPTMPRDAPCRRARRGPGVMPSRPCCRASSERSCRLPPAFSAIKIDGERAYDLARAGETVELEPRPVRIDALTLMRHARSRYRRARGPVRQGHLRARAGARHGSCARLPRPRRCAAPHARCLLRRGGGGHDGSCASGGRRGRSAPCTRCCCPSKPRSPIWPCSMSGRTMPRACCAASRCSSAAAMRRPAPGPAYATCKGHLIAVGRIERGELHPIRVFNFSGG